LAAGLAIAQPKDPAANTLQAGAQLSPDETLQQGGQYKERIYVVKGRVEKLTSQAEQRKDIIKTTCLRDKREQIRGHVVVTDRTYDSLKQAVQTGDNDGRKHEFTRITILYEKVVVLGTEAENCIGEDSSYVGKTKTDVDVDPSIPKDDPTDKKDDPLDTTRPPAASPFV
jgi:hypothetical protein